MKPVIFSNEDGTQKVTFIISTIDDDEGHDTNVKVEFEPNLGLQDQNSLHLIMANTFMAGIQGQ